MIIECGDRHCPRIYLILQVRIPQDKEGTMGNIYGYVRVSTREQNEDRQVIAMREMDVCDRNIFIDKQSGKDFKRPMYKRMLRRLKEGDLLYVKSIDRLGRNYSDLIEQWRIITKDKGADIYVIDMPILDTRKEKNLLGTFISDLVLVLLGYVAENERMNIKSRQAEGIAAAKERGVVFGRPSNPLPENFERTCRLWFDRQITLEQAGGMLGMPASTFRYQAMKYKKSIEETNH